jgi:tetrahydromethanopterin S-methyltransferase subunit A
MYGSKFIPLKLRAVFTYLTRYIIIKFTKVVEVINNMSLEDMYTIKDAVKYIEDKTGKEFKERKMMYLIRREKVKATKAGWVWLVYKDEVERLVSEHM